MISGDGTSHEPIRKIIELLKAGDYKLWDRRIDILDNQTLFYSVGFRQNREAHVSISIESKNHKNLSDNNRRFRADVSHNLGLYRTHWWGEFTDEEWEFFSTFNYPLCHDLKLDLIMFSLYE